MILDLILTTILGIVALSFLLFVLLIVLGAFFWRPDHPFSSGVLKFALVALGNTGDILIKSGQGLILGDKCCHAPWPMP
ncbi:MAG: hypothetical protein FD187_2011 [bacterium]|nr:MAG: hypothetical protein FD142_1040 [bacterium]KAF0148325.1 MAG: hypothetical protein FD187_2011 [bacterium]KAF0167786.1 MAG: hypothetical protein FD158_1913 [bacterium]TXT17106.1 MAG: hypothetical protein FD132_2563 [bacterium]